MIHTNPNLTDIQKLEYLKTHVKGEAASLVSHLTLNVANYAIAWDLLMENYENRRKIISTLLDKVLSKPKLEPKTMLNYLRETTEILHYFNAASSDTILVYLMEKKMDPTRIFTIVLQRVSTKKQLR